MIEPSWTWHNCSKRPLESQKNQEVLNDQILASVKKKIKADRYCLLTPFERDQYGDNELFISINNLDSFRRLQQVLLAALVSADKKRDVCPFCQSPLTAVGSEDQARHLCPSCRTLIVDTICPLTTRDYSYTTINHFRPQPETDTQYKWLAIRHQEGRLFFRNITKVDKDGQILCPLLKSYSNLFNQV